jgi:hypothetical protein
MSDRHFFHLINCVVIVLLLFVVCVIVLLLCCYLKEKKIVFFIVIQERFPFLFFEHWKICAHHWLTTTNLRPCVLALYTWSTPESLLFLAWFYCRKQWKSTSNVMYKGMQKIWHNIVNYQREEKYDYLLARVPWSVLQ